MFASTKRRLPSHLTESRSLALGMVLLVVSSGCNSKEQAAAPSFKVGSTIKTLEVLEAKDVPTRPGQHAIAAVPSGDGLAILIDGGGPRYVSLGDTLVEVCPTAGSISAHDERIAVGCAPLGSASPHVQIVQAGAVASTVEFEIDGPATSMMQWPVVDAKLEQVAIPHAAGVSIAQLDDPAKRIAVGSSSAVELATIEFSASSRWVALGRSDGSVELIDPSQDKTVALTVEQPDEGCAIAFSADENRVAVSSFWGKFRLYTIDGKLMASDATGRDVYGLNDVAFVGKHIMQIEAGTLVVRDLDGARISTQTKPSSSAGTKPFAPADLGSLGFVAAAGNQAIVTIDGPGLSTTSLSVP